MSNVLTDGSGNVLVFGPDTLLDGPDAPGGGGGGTVMPSLDNIVNVSIDARTRSISQKGFGTPLLVCAHNKYPDIVRAYDAASCLTAMVADGFETDHPGYLMAQACLSQSPSPTTVKIGKMSAAVAHTVELTPINTTQGTVYKFNVCAKPGGTAVTISYTVGASESVATICTALQALLAAATATSGVTSTNNTTKLTLTQAAGKLISVSDFACVPDRRILAVRDTTAAPGSGYGAAITNIAGVDGDFYGIATDVNSKAVMLEVAAVVETMRRVYASSAIDPDCANVGVTTDAFYTAKSASYSRTWGALKQDRVFSTFGSAELGKILPFIPGTYTAAFKTIAGEFADNGFSLESAIQGKNGNWYETLAGISILYPGQMFSGQFIDVTIFIDLLTARIQEACYGLLINNPKIPFTKSGLESVRSVIKNILNANTESNKNPLGGIAADPAPYVNVPDVLTVSANDKAARRLTGVTFTAVTSGALQSITVNGTVIL